MKKYLIAAITVCMILMLCATVYAKEPVEKLTADWVPTVVPMNDDTVFLRDESVRSQVGEILSQKIHSLVQSGDFPYVLQETAHGKQSIHQISASAPLVLIPLSTVDRSFDTKYTVGNSNLYRSMIFSGLSLAVCKPKVEDRNIEIQYTIPLNAYTTIKSDHAITQAEKLDAYLQLVRQSIQQDLVFDKKIKWNEDVEWKNAGKGSYQVVEVDIGSPSGKKLFPASAENGEISPYDRFGSIIANLFTVSYQKNSGHLVQMPRTGSAWKEDVVTHAYTLERTVPQFGRVTFAMTEPQHAITLNLYGMGKQKLALKQESDVADLIGYRIGMRKTSQMNRMDEPKEKREVTKSAIQKRYKTQNVHVDISDENVVMELAIDTVLELGKMK